MNLCKGPHEHGAGAEELVAVLVEIPDSTAQRAATAQHHHNNYGDDERRIALLLRFGGHGGWGGHVWIHFLTPLSMII